MRTRIIASRSSIGLRMTVCAGALLAGSAAHANLLTNGSFETPIVEGGYYVHRNGAELTGWTLFSSYRGTVHFDTTYDPVADGTQAVQIEVGQDWISQSFATKIGSEYAVSFALSAYSGYGSGCPPSPCKATLDVTAGSFSGSYIGTSAGYVTHTLNFVADSAVSTLTFKNAAAAGQWWNYSHLDAVSVVPVPEVPEPAAALLLIGGLGMLRIRTRRRS